MTALRVRNPIRKLLGRVCARLSCCICLSPNFEYGWHATPDVRMPALGAVSQILTIVVMSQMSPSMVGTPSNCCEKRFIFVLWSTLKTIWKSAARMPHPIQPIPAQISVTCRSPDVVTGGRGITTVSSVLAKRIESSTDSILELTIRNVDSSPAKVPENSRLLPVTIDRSLWGNWLSLRTTKTARHVKECPTTMLSSKRSTSMAKLPFEDLPGPPYLPGKSRARALLNHHLGWGRVRSL